METKRSYKGMKKYEALLKAVCCMEDYYDLTESEWEGCLGVACVISVIEGVPPTLVALSKHLDVPHFDVNFQRAFERLRINGVLGNRYALYNDPALNGNGEATAWQTSAEVERNAWCTIAGMASGFCGMREIVLKSENVAV